MLNIKQLEKLENDYLDLQIKEINEEEKRETQKIKDGETDEVTTHFREAIGYEFREIAKKYINKI